MPFPLTGIIDDFNRADAEPPSSNWTSSALGAAEGDLRILTNVCAAESDGHGSGWWNVRTFGPNCEAYVSITTLPTDDSYPIGLFLRVQSPGTAGVDGYVLNFDLVSAGTDTLTLSRIDNQVATQLGATISQNFANGDGFGLQAIGSTLEVFYRSGAGGSFASLGTRTDATYGAAGNLALALGLPDVDTGVRVDDFGGGTIVSQPPGFITQRRHVFTRRRLV